MGPALLWSWWPGCCLKLVLLFHSVRRVHSSFVVPDLPLGAYIMPGDLVLGGLFRVHTFGEHSVCGSQVRSPKSYQYVEAMVHAIELVNAQPGVLPNISLGFSILDDCNKDQVALTRTMGFLPPAPCCSNCSQSLEAPYYDVIGVISGTNSQNTITAATLLNIFRIPMVAAVATSELLSDPDKYGYFARVVPSDKFQAQVIIDILTRFNWTYVSVIYSAGSYGEMGAREVTLQAPDRGICVAYQKLINRNRGKQEYTDTVKNLVKYKNARAVVLFTQGEDARRVVSAAVEAGAAGYFVWIGSDAVSGSDLAGFEQSAAGTFFVELYSTGIESFPQYFEDLHPSTSSNPWLEELWHQTFKCEATNKENNRSCDSTESGCHDDSAITTNCGWQYKMGEMPGYKPYKKTALFLDTVLTFAHAIHAFINDRCPQVFQDKDLLHSCVKGDQLMPYILNVTFDGSYGRVTFDENGDGNGKYQIAQLQRDGNIHQVIPVGTWDKATETLEFQKELYWGHFSDLSENAEVITSVPESLCSKPCPYGFFSVQQELKCCWECRPCRDNEIVSDNGTSCEQCPLYTWPEQVMFEECHPIAPSYLAWTDTRVLLCAVIAFVGVVSCFAMLVVYIKHKDDRLIKATSRGLSLLALGGTFLAYITAVFVLDKPNTVSCYAARLGFNISFTIAYAPLLAKTNRIYRIFAAAKFGTKPPSFISSRSQMLFSSVMIFLQLLISVLTMVLYPPEALLRMPVVTEQYVEMLCDLPMEGLVPPLTYNVLLIVSCSMYAFKARSLPDNFNESRYIFLSVCTTLFLWLAFIPTYFTAFYAPHKALLLALALLINSSVTLLCLYVPKCYAIFYVEEERMRITATMTITPSDGVSSSSTAKTNLAPPTSVQVINVKPQSSLAVVDI